MKRKVSLKALDYGKVEEAAKGTVRQTVTLNVGINQDKAREIGKFVKEPRPQGRLTPDRRAISSASAARSATTSRTRSRRCASTTSASRSSSPTSATDVPDAHGAASRRRATRSSVGGWRAEEHERLAERDLAAPRRNGLMM